MNEISISVAICLLFGLCFGPLEAWGSGKKVKLSDVKTLTLHHGYMTTGQRTKPVPQLQCVGGTAGCSKFVPQVVQCYNRGSDGYDIQWKCKTDMDNAYRFGKIDVICEGYDYPDDPYILKGSCGLEYTVDLTEEGIKRSGSSHQNYQYGSADHSHSYPQSYKKSKGESVGHIILVIGGCLVIYALYKTCLSPRQHSRTSDGFDSSNDRFRNSVPPPPGFHSSNNSSKSAPPPPGFRTNYGPDESCGASGTSSTGGSSGAGNFWTGAMTGGMLGYMFGNRNSGRQTYDRTFDDPFFQPTRRRSWGGSAGFGSSFGSTGTRMASGFGGTKRR